MRTACATFCSLGLCRPDLFERVKRRTGGQLIDGAYAAMLVRKDPAMMQAAIAAARVLLKNAGVRVRSLTA